ncbi:uncharacterized protein ARMOST_12146 [Armillaria ostoyae]|uniref:Uncharacterized protein n=1 Tax=Armillaria ostoyae TaxID=47428 RepID=A0A284RJ40_ARMOS|nr:uncharacterized protein ARMOST_12146 [Armillaria ostoyae]
MAPALNRLAQAAAAI